MTTSIDVTATIRDGMVHWPGNPEVRLSRALDIARGGDANVSKLELGVHTGTHVDAPVHFIEGASGVDELPLDGLIGPARVVELPAVREITAGDLRPHGIRRGERILFKTSNSARCWTSATFVPDYVFLTEGGARHLIEQGVRTVGIDYLSIGGGEDSAATHRALLSSGVCIIEGLDLRAASAGEYDLLCLPLKLHQADGAPARVVLRPHG